MSLRILVLGLAVCACSLAGCGGGGGDAGESSTGAKAVAPVEIQLQEESGSGEVGTAMLSAEGAKTKVEIVLVSHAANRQPAHIHRGTCTNLDATPAYPLDNVVDGKSTTVVAAALDSLLAKDYAINVHRSAKKLNEYVLCGNIGRNAAPAQTYTTNDEGGDGY
jgi:hypothetical protein